MYPLTSFLDTRKYMPEVKEQVHVEQNLFSSQDYSDIKVVLLAEAGLSQ